MYDNVVFQSNEESISILQSSPVVQVLSQPESIKVVGGQSPEVSFLNENTPKVVFVTTVDTVPGGGGGTAQPLTLKTYTYNFSLSANAGIDTSVPMGSTYLFVGFTCTQPDIRVRAYTSVAARAADVSRSTSTWATSADGVVFDGLTATGYLSMNWSPSPAGYTVDESTSAPVRVDNKASTSSAGSITFYYYSAS